MYPHIPPADPDSIMNELTYENHALKAQVHTLNEHISSLKSENVRLRAIIAPPPPPQPAGHIYMGPSDNALHLPVVIESLAVMQDHFRRQGTLRQCSTNGCNKYAFDQVCFREGHMAWCRTHNRIITRTYTSCSVRAEERGDCVPVSWEDRHDWQEIVNRAYREGKIGHKGLESGYLNALLFLPVYNPPPAGQSVSHSQDAYPPGGWA